MTQAKLFYYGFAHVWAGSAQPECLRTRVQTEPHPPAKFRVHGTLRNFPSFAQTIALQPGDNLYTDTPCRVW